MNAIPTTGAALTAARMTATVAKVKTRIENCMMIRRKRERDVDCRKEKWEWVDDFSLTSPSPLYFSLDYPSL